MAKRGVKAKDHERLEPSNIEKVIKLLSEGITKKEACSVLNISYNTARLKRIIEEHEESVARRKARFKKNRGIAIDTSEAGRIVQGYLKGDTQADLVEYFARPASTIKRVIENLDVPERPKGDDKYKTSFLPDRCVKESFEVGEIVWSAKYHTSAEVMKCYGKDKSGTFNVYRIYVFEPSEMRAIGGRYHDCASYDLGSLAHLKDYIDTSRLTS